MANWVEFRPASAFVDRAPTWAVDSASSVVSPSAAIWLDDRPLSWVELQVEIVALPKLDRPVVVRSATWAALKARSWVTSKETPEATLLIWAAVRPLTAVVLMASTWDWLSCAIAADDSAATWDELKRPIWVVDEAAITVGERYEIWYAVRVEIGIGFSAPRSRLRKVSRGRATWRK